MSNEVFFWPFLKLSPCIISARSKSKSMKRNNSCILYLDISNTIHYGVVEKLISFSESLDDYSTSFAVITEIIQLPARDQICRDNITKAQLHKHLVACQPLRLVKLL